MKTTYEIVDLQTKAVVGRATTRHGATRSADRRNLEYGAHRFYVRTVQVAA